MGILLQQPKNHCISSLKSFKAVCANVEIYFHSVLQFNLLGLMMCLLCTVFLQTIIFVICQYGFRWSHVVEPHSTSAEGSRLISSSLHLAETASCFSSTDAHDLFLFSE